MERLQSLLNMTDDVIYMSNTKEIDSPVFHHKE